jgi:2-methylcitrate dehydratase PrpD
MVVMAVAATAPMPDVRTMGLTTEVVRWCAGLDLDDVPDPVLEVACHCLLDWLTVTVAGAHEPLTRMLAEELVADASGVTVIARGQRASLADAALINGAANHALDYDDVHLAMPGHPSAPVFAALLAVAEDAALDGPSFLRAAICGLEAELRLGELAKPDHYERGWHATATVGTIGAAIACAEALGADDAQRRAAIGLAVSQLAGVKSMFGSMGKPFQVGKAAASGVLAARLAMRGMTSHPGALEDTQGFLPLYSSWDGSFEPWSNDSFGLVDTLFKYHAACYFTHAGIDAALDLQRRQPDASTITRVRLEANPSNSTVCDIRRPTSGLEAKFSMTATTSMALLGIDTASPATYDDEIVTDHRLRDLIERVEVAPNDQLERTQMIVTLTLHDGTELTASGDAGQAERDFDRQRGRLEAKAHQLAAPVVGAAATDAYLTASRDVLDLADVSTLLEAVEGGHR